MADRRAPRPSQGRVARTARLGRVAAGGAVRLAADRLDGRGSAEEQRQRRGDRLVASIDVLIDQLSAMRGAAMKAGQGLSMIEFPGLDEAQSAHLQRRLAELRDDVPPVSWKQMRKVLAREWGAEPERVLAWIDPEPVAAASIGQVYRAQTHEGTGVAVKVQYPGIAEVVEADMRSVRALLPLLRRLMPNLNVKELLGELRERIAEECDYELEAANHRRLARYWQGHPFILVPAVETGLARRRVLVSEWVEGIGFEEVIRRPEAVRDRYIEIVYRFYYGTAFRLDLACGDPHPGNYLLCSDGRVGFFDFGMMRRLPKDYVRREAAVSRAVRENDAGALLNALQRLGYVSDERSDHVDQALLQWVRHASAWRQREEPTRLQPGPNRRSPERRSEGSTERNARLEGLRLPPEALLLRRMQSLLYLVAVKARASAAWGPLHRELLEDAEPVGELGTAHAAWRAAQHR